MTKYINTHKLLDGKITLYQTIIKRDKKEVTNPVWQATIRSASTTGRLRISTKEKNLELAKEAARKLFYQSEARAQQGQKLNATKFAKAGRDYLVWLEQNSPTRNKFITHKRYLETHLIPHFGKKNLTAITTDNIETYYENRKRQGATGDGKPVSGYSKNAMSAVINAVYNYAIRRGLVAKAPAMPRYEAFATRPSFSLSEMDTLQEKLNAWINYDIKNNDSNHIQDYRKLFRLYINMIYYGGMRVGAEMSSIHWSNIEYREKDGQKFVFISVNTSKNKKGIIQKRGVVAMPQLIPYLEYIKEQPRIYNKNGFVFVHPNSTQLKKDFIGTPIRSFRSQWDSFMDFSGLRKENKPPHRERCLTSLRHTYMEQRILNNDVPLIALAKNCGTSIAVIQKWYAELEAQQFSTALAGLMMQKD